MMLCAAVSGILQQLAVHIEEVRICLSAGMNLGAGISRKRRLIARLVSLLQRYTAEFLCER